MFPPAPCANRNTGGSAPRMAGSNVAVTPCLPTATLHVLLRICESLPLAELAIRAQAADVSCLSPAASQSSPRSRTLAGLALLHRCLFLDGGNFLRRLLRCGLELRRGCGSGAGSLRGGPR